jgi:hypothetical protein
MMERIPTGIDFIDSALGGGQLARGLHGVLGPFGGGKTTLGIMIAVAGARLQHQQFLANKRAGRWVLFSIGQGGNEISSLIFSNAARLDRGLCFSQPDRGNLARHSRAIPEAQERVVMASRILERQLRHVDLDAYSASAPIPIRYLTGYLDAVAAEGPISGVVVDYVGRLISRYVGDSDKRLRRQSFLIRNFIEQSRSCIAARFSCPVWLIHQLRGAANQRSPGTPQHHLDGADCRHFGDDLDVCFCLGTRDRQSRGVLLSCTKAPLNKLPEPEVLVFESAFAALKRAPNLRLSRNLAKIVPAGSTSVECDDHTRALLNRLLGDNNQDDLEPRRT